MEKEKILIADDMETFLRLEKMLLERSGYHILTTNNGTDALKKIQLEKPLLAFLDLIMPDMNGDTVCRFVKTNKALKNTIVIMVTTRSDEESMQRCQQAGCDDYLTKPVTQRDLFEKLTKFLPIERRKFTRAPLRVSASCLEKDAYFTEYTVDISQGGLFIETVRPLPLGTELTVEFQLPKPLSAIKVGGQVMRHITPEAGAEPGPKGMGIKFTNITEEDSIKIQMYVSSV